MEMPCRIRAFHSFLIVTRFLPLTETSTIDRTKIQSWLPHLCVKHAEKCVELPLCFPSKRDDKKYEEQWRTRWSLNHSIAKRKVPLGCMCWYYVNPHKKGRRKDGKRKTKNHPSVPHHQSLLAQLFFSSFERSAEGMCEEVLIMWWVEKPTRLWCGT